MSISPESESPVLEVEPMPQQIGVPKGLDWTGVSDPARRRKLQNRLNQAASRARRRAERSRAALEVPASAKSRPSYWSALHREQSGNASNIGKESASTESCTHQSHCPNADPRVRAVIKQFTQHAYQQYQQGVPNLGHLHLVLQINVNTAFDYLAETIGMVSEYHDYDAISPLNKKGPLLGNNYLSRFRDWPESLRPTKLQFSIEHHPWIDLFPSPRLRDNILMAIEQAGVCDEDELCRDICHYDADTAGRAGLIVWGEASNPLNWEASVAFLEKWGYLLYECTELLESTNHWRARRRETTISRRVFAEAMVNSYRMTLKGNET